MPVDFPHQLLSGLLVKPLRFNYIDGARTRLLENSGWRFLLRGDGNSVHGSQFNKIQKGQKALRS